MFESNSSQLGNSTVTSEEKPIFKQGQPNPEIVDKPSDLKAALESAGVSGAEKKRIRLTINYDIKIDGYTQKVEFITIVPDNYEKRQEIIETTYLIEPDIISYGADNINKYAKFIIEDPTDDFSIDIVSDMYIYDYDLTKAAESREVKDDSLDIEKYLREEDYIDIHDPYLETIEEITIFTENALDKTRILYEYVLNNLDYHGYNPSSVTGIQALKDGGGDCTEYSDALITLCRAAGIPARFIEGYTINAKDMNQGHNWVEIYLDGYGWIPFDPTFDDSNADSINSTFEDLDNLYVYLSFIRNDDDLQSYHYYVYYLWGDEIEVTKNISVQEYI